MPRERRKNFRVEWNSAATIYDRNGRRARPCTVTNFSNGGAKITGIVPETIADEIMLRLSPHGRTRRCRVVWRTQDSLGVEFIESTLPPEAPSRQKTGEVPAL